MLNNLLRASHTSIGYVPTTPSPSFPSSSPSLDKKSSTKGMLVPSTTTTATNYETWIKTMEVLLRSSFPILSDRLRKLSKKRVNGTDNMHYDDEMYSPVTKTEREEEKLTELELDVLKAQNQNISSDNRVLKSERVTAVNFILLYVSSDSQNLLDQLIKQNASHILQGLKKKADEEKNWRRRSGGKE